MTDETMFEMQQIGVRIREERQNQKMSQAKLAELSNVSLPMISSIENGKSVMLLDTFLKIINALHVSADTILRPDTPNVSLMYQRDYAEVLQDCTPQECDAILNMAKQLKLTLRAQKNNDDY